MSENNVTNISMKEFRRERVKAIRKQHGLIQSEMADILGVNRTTYAYREKSGSFDDEDIKKVCSHFDMSMNEFLSGLTKDEIKNTSLDFTPIQHKPLTMNEDSFIDIMNSMILKAESVRDAKLIRLINDLSFDERGELIELIKNNFAKNK